MKLKNLSLSQPISLYDSVNNTQKKNRKYSSVSEIRRDFPYEGKCTH